MSTNTWSYNDMGDNSCFSLQYLIVYFNCLFILIWTWAWTFFKFSFFPNTIQQNLHVESNSSKGPSWPWSYGSWIYNYLRNQCLSLLMLWARISIRARCTTLCDKVCQWLATGLWFSPGTPVSSTNKTDRRDLTEILLKVALNTIKPNQPTVVIKTI